MIKKRRAKIKSPHVRISFKKKFGKTLSELSSSLKVSTATASRWTRCGFDVCEKARNVNLFKGESNKRLRRLWNNLKDRCGNPKNISYKYYGGKGILLRLERYDLLYLWKRDRADLLKKPSIDRLDSNGHYEINNCRFIEHKANGLMALSNWYYKSKKINKTSKPDDFK